MMASLWEKSCRASAQAGNASAMLTAYLACYLLENMADALVEDKPIEDLWEELSNTIDWILKASQCTAQATGRALGLAVAGVQGLWLGLTALPEKEKRALGTRGASLARKPSLPSRGLHSRHRRHPPSRRLWPPAHPKPECSSASHQLHPWLHGRTLTHERIGIQLRTP